MHVVLVGLVHVLAVPVLTVLAFCVILGLFVALDHAAGVIPSLPFQLPAFVSTSAPASRPVA